MTRFLLLCCLVLLVSILPAHSSASSSRHHAPRFPTSNNPLRISGTYRRPWTRLRDSVIEYVFGIPPKEQPVYRPEGARKANAGPARAPPSNLRARYGGDVVLRFNISNYDEAKSLAEATDVLFLDVWEFNDEWVDIRLSKDVLPSLLGLLPISLHNSHTPLMHDLALAIYESYPSSSFPAPLPIPNSQTGSSHSFTPALRTSTHNLFFQDFQPLSVIWPWLRLLSSLFPTHVQLSSVGLSYEGREIPCIRLGVHPTNSQLPSSPRDTILITGGSHAREWISVSTANYVLYTLITSYGKDPVITKLLSNFDFVFVPILNPDGYEYTWGGDRLWRKNRQQTSVRFCRGIDLDRSWSFEWDGEASAGNPCSESFAGESAFDAIESTRLADWARNETFSGTSNFVAFLDLHSYSQQVLYPFSYNCAAKPPGLENLEELAIGLAKAIRLETGEFYSITSACRGGVVPSGLPKDQTKKKPKSGAGRSMPAMESGGGSALDWFYARQNVRYAYQLKLRDQGSYGFLLPREHIIPTGREVFAAVKYLGDFLMGNKGIENTHGKDGGGERKQERPLKAEERAPFTFNEPDLEKESPPFGGRFDLRR
ncbi:MAG: putative metallocarboxypeptidase ecm14 [Vezdaea aestivalis]|nr:MAG: putative metallocarboxypeptidase ecm14 [Vezdaea aestivalis]